MNLPYPVAAALAAALVAAASVLTGLGAMHGSLAVLLSWRNGTSRLSNLSGSAHALVRGMQ